MRSSRERLASSGAVAIFAMMLLVPLAPSRAVAGCTRPHSAPVAGFDRLARAGALTPDAPAVPRACNGPSCSRRDAAPLAHTPVPIPDNDRVARLDPPALPRLVAPWSSWAEHEDCARPVALGPSIFHPPRPADADRSMA